MARRRSTITTRWSSTRTPCARSRPRSSPPRRPRRRRNRRLPTRIVVVAAGLTGLVSRETGDVTTFEGHAAQSNVVVRYWTRPDETATPRTQVVQSTTVPSPEEEKARVTAKLHTEYRVADSL